MTTADLIENVLGAIRGQFYGDRSRDFLKGSVLNIDSRGATTRSGVQLFADSLRDKTSSRPDQAGFFLDAIWQ